MSPRAFVQRPYRWIKNVAAIADGAGTVRPRPPNFAFVSTRRIRGLPKEGRCTST
ncbi:hypothetical protein GS444_21170, partial [Rhodococcus hoagii]|nr:hypothetical protein [Prescottella equi]